MNVSALVITRDEERCLPGCLESLAWCDDVLVLDSFSTDSTVERARAAGARVMQRAFFNFADQRNFGLEQGGLRHDWVLHLDADERVPEALRAELAEVTLHSPEADGYFVASKMVLRGRWLKHAATYPAYQARLGRRNRLRFRMVGHGQRETLPRERMGTLREPLMHDAFAKGLEDWLEKHRRYAECEAQAGLADEAGRIDWSGLARGADPVRRRRALKGLAARLPGRSCDFCTVMCFAGVFWTGPKDWSTLA